MSNADVPDCLKCMCCGHDFQHFFCGHRSAMYLTQGVGLSLHLARSAGFACGPEGKQFEPASDDVLRARGLLNQEPT